METLKRIMDQMEKHKQIKAALEHLHKMRRNGSCHIIEFYYERSSIPTEVFDWGADQDEGAFCKAMVDSAISYFEEELKASEMLLGMAEMALKRMEDKQND